MNKNLPRWIKASVMVNFEALREGIALRSENDDRVSPANDSIEVRLDIAERCYSKGVTYYDVYINVIVTCVRDERDSYKWDKMVGIAAAALVPTIVVLKYGDDKSQLGCLEIEDELDIINFGAAEGTPNILYSTVEAAYCLTLTD